MNRSLPCALAWLAISSLGLLAPITTAAETPAPKTLAMKITVIDAVTQQPVVGAEVSLSGLREPPKNSTDAAGVAMLDAGPDVPQPEKLTQFSFRVVHPNYEPRVVEWFSDRGHVRDDLPAEYTVKLPAGVTIGGVVRDEHGAPVVGAKIIGFAAGLRSRPMGRGDKVQQEYGSISVTEQDGVVTDAEGRWHRDHFPSEITLMTMQIVRPGGGRTGFMLGNYRGPADRSGTLDPAKLRDLSAAFVLKDGLTVRGLVVDEAGRPVPGVQLRVRDAGTRNQPDLFANQADGTFALEHWDAASVLLTAEKNGYQTKSATIALNADAGPARIVLAAAKPLVLRLVGEKGEPVANAELQTDPNPSPEQIVSWKAKTDAEGRVEWPTAPDKPVNLWIAPPPGSTYPYRTARLTADGAEHTIRLRTGADKSVRVQIRAVDAETGAAVTAFEVWRRVANQPFKPWGDPATAGAFTQELTPADLPNGFVPSYRLQVRAAGYTGWSSESINFQEGDQELTLKLQKGESSLANEPPSPSGRGIDGNTHPQLLPLAATVARLLEDGDIAAFTQATNASSDDWKRALPAGVDPQKSPGSDRTVQRTEKNIRASATHLLALAARAGLTPGKVKFTVKSVSAPSLPTISYRVEGQSVSFPSPHALRVVLAGEPVAGADPRLRGDYELSIGTTKQFPTGWRIEEGVRWTAFPGGLADEATRRELSLANRLAGADLRDQRTLSGADDPALLALGQSVTELIRTRATEKFVGAATLTRAELEQAYAQMGWSSVDSAVEGLGQLTPALTAATDAMLALLQRVGADLSDAKLTVRQVLAERPRFARFGEVEGLRANPVRVMFAVESTRTAKSGTPVAGNYTVTLGDMVRLQNRWMMVDDKIRFQEFPKGLIAADDAQHVELENYVAEHQTLPPGHAAPEIELVKLADNTKTSLAAYRGKVVVLEFWATWCGPCQEPMEHLQDLRATKPEWGDRVEVIALSIDDAAGTARDHLAKRGWTKTSNVWAGDGGWKSAPVHAFRVRGVPTAYVLDREGKVVQAGHPLSLDFAKLVDNELRKTR